MWVRTFLGCHRRPARCVMHNFCSIHVPWAMRKAWCSYFPTVVTRPLFGQPSAVTREMLLQRHRPSQAIGVDLMVVLGHVEQHDWLGLGWLGVAAGWFWVAIEGQATAYSPEVAAVCHVQGFR